MQRWTVGAVAQKDPSTPWTQAEVQERIWALESRADNARNVDTVTLTAIGVAALSIVGIAAVLWSRR